MSNKLINRVFASPHPPLAIERLLLVAIADCTYDRLGYCERSIQFLAVRIARSRRQTMRLLRKLEADGELLIERRPYKVSRYRFPPVSEETAPSLDRVTLDVTTPPAVRGGDTTCHRVVTPDVTHSPIAHRNMHRDETGGSTPRARAAARKIASRRRGPA
jgi:phage terminase large subunit-like protein